MNNDLQLLTAMNIALESGFAHLASFKGVNMKELHERYRLLYAETVREVLHAAALYEITGQPHSIDPAYYAELSQIRTTVQQTLCLIAILNEGDISIRQFVR